MDSSSYHRIVLVTLLFLIWRDCCRVGLADALNVEVNSQISVREGQSVTLVCTYEPSTESQQFGSLSWQTGDTVLAAHSCTTMCRTRNLNTAKYSLAVDKMSSGNLTITGITLDDDNRYQCGVTTLVATKTSEVQLVVLVPPSSLRLYDASTPNGHENGAIVPVLADQSYTMTCATTPGANPPAVLRWTSDTVETHAGTQTDQPVANSKLKTSTQEVTFIPTMVDHLTRVTCEALHSALDTNLEKFVQLDVQVPPSQVDISHHSKIVAADSTLTLQEDVPATISCSSLGTRPASAISWYLDGGEAMSGVSRTTFSVHPDDSRLSDAARSIVIQPTRDYHGKVLRCVATTFGISLDVTIQLAVEGPPDPPVIPAVPQDLTENQRTTISCRADNGHPAPSFQWFIGGRNLTEHASLQMSADVDNRIDATSQLSYVPSREDNGLALQCSVTHPTLSQPMNVMSDTLVVNYCPTSAEVIVCPEVIAGSSELLVCQSGVSNPAASLVWTKGTEMIDEPRALQTHFEENATPKGTRTTLTYIRNFTLDDQLESFRCCATQSAICVSAVCSEPCVPNVLYPPSVPVLSRNLPGSFINEGVVDLEITCRSDGNPTPSLVWVSTDNPGLMLDQVTQEDGSQLLRFRKVRRKHAGIYKCLANSRIPPPNEAEDHLIVVFPPTITNKVENRSAANEGSNTTLTCVAEGNPMPTIEWMRLGNKSELVLSEVSESQENTDYKGILRSTLTIVSVNPKEDHGNYRCTARSVKGTDELVINLSGTSKPEPPTQLQVNVSETTSHSLLVSWLPGYNGGVAQTFVVKYCLNGSQEYCEHLYGIRGQEITVDALEAFSWYTISVSAENTNGMSGKGNEVLTSTSPLSPGSYGITVTSDNGLVTLISDPDMAVPEEICFKIESKGDGPCNPESRCFEAGVKVQKPSKQPVTVVSFGRGLCSPPMSVQVANLATQPSVQPTVTGAIIGSIVVIALVAVVVLIIVRRNHDRKQKGAAKFGGSVKRPGLECPASEKNGQARAFLSGGYCAYNPVYDDVSGEDKSKHEGRMVSDDGLIYAEVAHMRKHPDGKPPIRTEEPTIYASLDFNQMKADGKRTDADSNREEEKATEKETLLYENITPQGLPLSP